MLATKHKRQEQQSNVSNDSNKELKRIMILGLGKSGMSVARFLREQGISFLAVDTRMSPPNKTEIMKLLPKQWMSFGELSEDMFADLDELIVSPGIAIQQPLIKQAIQNGVSVVGDIELFVRAAKAPIIAITGSNGKSTVTALLGEMATGAGLKVKVGGNIGVPALDLLEGETPDFYILELSSFQLETTGSLKAFAATVLNISADHMDRYDSVNDYAAAKYKVYQDCQHKVINSDEPCSADWVEGASNDDAIFTLSQLNSGEGNNAFGIQSYNNDSYLYLGTEKIIAINLLKIAGKHNHANALAALALGQSMGLSLSSMVETLKTFPGLPHRTQWVASKNDVHWYNDSKGTNVGATIAAIKGFSGQKILIAGGQGKGADFHELGDAVAKENISLVILYGQDAPLIKESLSTNTSYTLVGSVEEAVELANKKALPGEVVLFSPACASFDMFENFEVRGDTFIKAVKKVTA